MGYLGKLTLIWRCGCRFYWLGGEGSGSTPLKGEVENINAQRSWTSPPTSTLNKAIHWLKKKKVDANCLYEVLSWPHCGAGSRRPGARMVLQSCSSLEWRSWAFFTSAVTSDCVQQTVPEGGLTLGKAVSLAEVIPARADSSLRQQLGV